MASDLQIVCDNNVIVSAVMFPRSVPRQAFDRALELGDLLLSAATVAKLNDVLRRDRFNRYVSEDQRRDFLAALIREAKLVDVTEVVTDCRDPKDNKFMELAISGRATCIISGDQDLLVLDPFRGIPVVTPQAFLAMFPAERS